MKFTVELNVGDAPDPEALSQFLAWGARLDIPQMRKRLEIGDVAVEAEGGENDVKRTLTFSAPEAESEPAPVVEGRRKPGRPRKVPAPPQAEPESAPVAETAPPPPPPPPAPPAGMALPPGIAMPPAPQPTAMPQVVPAAAAETGGDVPLEVFREAYRQSHTAKPGAAFVLFKAPAWPDGTPKGVWFTAESVPPDQRERMMMEMSML